MKNQLQRALKWGIAFVALCTLSGGMPSAGYAELVMKMSMPASAPGNMELTGGMFRMSPDGNGGTSGERDTSIVYMIDPDPGQALSSVAAIGDGSMTLTGMTATAPPVTNASFMVQGLSSGSFSIYDAGNTLLLSGNLTTSALQGALGAPNPQALYVGFGEVTGGTLAHRLDPESLQLRIKYPEISGGFNITSPPNPRLSDFTTWTSTVEVMAIVIPEPSLTLSLSALAWMLWPTRRRRPC